MGSDKLEGMFLFAIQGEINDSKTYLELAERVEHPFLKTKLKFLAEEEEQHKSTLEEMYKVYYPEKAVLAFYLALGKDRNGLRLAEGMRLSQLR